LRLANVAATNFDDLAIRVQLPSAWEHRFLCTLPELSPGYAGFCQWSMPIVSGLLTELPLIASYNPVDLINSARNRAVDMRAIVMAICARAVHELRLLQRCVPGHGWIKPE
jgi:hypothetical protein